jgi:hypothetical protein
MLPLLAHPPELLADRPAQRLALAAHPLGQGGEGIGAHSPPSARLPDRFHVVRRGCSPACGVSLIR